ncbi:cytochrome P450 [Amniculicola lignicola CBS 123094]|uniref:Cytochrome P450 n=1 Tax=Amniculicola lignicola CBS 123094 TaxID=1392246 RepID=A0A6A5W4Y0_9PLEO|nr:cytochrome P450 [Amniculicola lignicola CBS 123094]
MNFTDLLVVNGSQEGRVEANTVVPSLPLHFPILIVAGILITSFLHLHSRNRPSTPQSRFWNSIPISGVRNEYFSWARATLRSVFSSKAMVDAGYSSYSSKNTLFATPSIDRGAFVVVPPNQLKPIYNLPESEVDVHWSQSETIQAKYTVANPEVFQNGFHVNVIRNQLTRNLDYLTKGIAEELELGFARHWGNTKEWTSVLAWPSCLRIVAESVNRVFVGAPQCRDAAFLEGMKWHAEWVFSNATLINSLPAFLRPIVGFFVRLYGHRVRRKCITPMLPLIQTRLSEFLSQKDSPDPNWEPAKDGLQWLIEESWKTGEGKYLDPWRIGHRLLILNFVSMHTTSFTVTNTLLDLFSTSPSIGTASDLREECFRVFREHNGLLTKEAVSKLHLLDSTIRESMRHSSFSILALPRRVVAPEGITLKNGTHIPYGIPLATPMDAIHFDPAFYTDPSNFHPFRFCTPAQVAGTRTASHYANSHLDPTVPSPKSTVTLDDKFLAFGFGRNACPGRFFALHEMKLMLAYILMNFEIEYMERRPEQFKIMWVQLPKETTGLRVRRREDGGVWQKFE